MPVPTDDLPDTLAGRVPADDIPEHLASASTPKDTESPGPWPGVASAATPDKSSDQSALGHIGGAMASAFKGPYGPSKETLRPFVEGGVPVVNAINRAIIGPVGTVLDAAGRPIEAAKRGIAAGGGEVARALGLGNPAMAERDLNALGDVALMLGSSGPVTSAPKPPKPGMLSSVGRINASDQAKDTIRAGFVLPPAEASEGHIGQVNLTNLAAGEAGKIKLGQMAAAKNQPLVNVYARDDLGLPPEAPLSPQAFRDVRAREGQVYQEVVNAVPEIDLARDKEFASAVDKVGSRSAETERLFPSTKEPPGIPALRGELMANARGSTQAVMDYIADLRKNATANFQKDGDAMAHRFGAAQREAATALEDAMERSVENAPQYYREKLDGAIARRAEIDADLRTAQPPPGVRRDPVSPHGRLIEGLRDQRAAAEQQVNEWSARLANANAKNQDNQTLLDRFRKARQTMAKSYDVEAATNVSTGDISAAGLGRLLQQGKPLSGNLKLIADSANSFPRAFQNPRAFGGVESYSVLDTAAAAGMALAGHPIAATMVGARPLLRGRVLSPGWQRRMIEEPADAMDTRGAADTLGRAGALTAGASGALGGPQ